MYTSREAAVTAIRELGVGWTLLPYDDPERGLQGIYAFKKGEGVEKTLQWPVRGRALEPEVELCSGEDLLAFVQSQPAEVLYPCDNPQKRLIGFVSYRRAPEGKSEVCYVSLTTLRTMPATPRSLLLGLREVELANGRNRTAALQVVKPYGRLRAWFMRLVRRFFPLR